MSFIPNPQMSALACMPLSPQLSVPSGVGAPASMPSNMVFIPAALHHPVVHLHPDTPAQSPDVVFDMHFGSHAPHALVWQTPVLLQAVFHPASPPQLWKLWLKHRSILFVHDPIPVKSLYNHEQPLVELHPPAPDDVYCQQLALQSTSQPGLRLGIQPQLTFILVLFVHSAWFPSYL